MRTKPEIWKAGGSKPDDAPTEPLRRDAPSIVICPKAALGVWVMEIRFFLPGFNVIEYRAEERED